MAYIGSKDLALEIAKGNVPGHVGVNKFGRAPAGAQTTPTDIWDRADATPTQQIWVAPTTARIHNIASTSPSDDGSPVGVGARTIQVYGLTGWDAAEVSEVITMDGTTNVPTSNAYVIIHRMKVLTKGTGGPNVGVITATAVTDGTVTAQINAGQGQTQMAIYGVPSIQTAFITNYYFSLADLVANPATANEVQCSLLINPGPDAELTGFLTKSTEGLNNTGSSRFQHGWNPYFPVAGPAIIKCQATAFLADTDTSAGFDIILVDN
jgi:hypothetical protein